MITFQEEPLDNILEELKVLTKRTWDEVDQRNVYFDLNPDWDLYKLLNQNGNVKFLTARHDGVMIGYLVIFIHADLHIKGESQAVTDVIYFDENYRGQGIANRLIELAENILMSLGVKWFSISLKNFQRHDMLMSECGYKHLENVYQKYLM